MNYKDSIYIDLCGVLHYHIQELKILENKYKVAKKRKYKQMIQYDIDFHKEKIESIEKYMKYDMSEQNKKIALRYIKEKI